MTTNDTREFDKPGMFQGHTRAEWTALLENHKKVIERRAARRNATRMAIPAFAAYRPPAQATPPRPARQEPTEPLGEREATEVAEREYARGGAGMLDRDIFIRARVAELMGTHRVCGGGRGVHVEVIP